MGYSRRAMLFLIGLKGSPQEPSPSRGGKASAVATGASFPSLMTEARTFLLLVAKNELWV